MAKGNGSARPPGTIDPQNAPRLKLLHQYIKDLSFENLAAQAGLRSVDSPNINMNVNLDAHPQAEPGQFELVFKLRIEATGKAEQKPVFLLEMEYGSLFLLENIPENEIKPVLLVECPRMIYPFVRRVVSDITSDGGFTPLNMELIDFMAMYMAEMERQQAAQN